MNVAAGQDTRRAEAAAFSVVFALSLCHLLNDLMQSMLTALYPLFAENFHLDFGQVGMLTFVFQATASLLQPAIGAYGDKRALTVLLPLGMAFTFAGLVLLAFSGFYALLLVSAGMIGIGSAIFHPESSRVARLASGGRHGTAQAVFQVGGNFGSAIGPLLAAFVVVPFGQRSITFVSVFALTAMAILWRVAAWYGAQSARIAKKAALPNEAGYSNRKIAMTIGVLALLVFSKYTYMASISSYYTFYVIKRFDVSVQVSQILLFVFLGAVAVGTFAGGPIGDRVGRKTVIWFSILGVLPFTLALPYANLPWTIVLTILIGLILSSAFSAIVVFAQELVPGRVGMIAGLFFGFAFGIGGIAAAGLGELADIKGIEFVYWLCSFLPILGLLTVFLPNVRER
ncbi:MFS transporter [Aureimonas leprariae]|uniref:MFS transporter n=2 Tax=Plantimonas leprariae TaxID=2615207 RepID=A0A7V7PKZ2_9HYPH|nr:MFS transporter [Aureimonas leprariae]